MQHKPLNLAYKRPALELIVREAPTPRIPHRRQGRLGGLGRLAAVFGFCRSSLSRLSSRCSFIKLSEAVLYGVRTLLAFCKQASSWTVVANARDDPACRYDRDIARAAARRPVTEAAYSGERDHACRRIVITYRRLSKPCVATGRIDVRSRRLLLTSWQFKETG